MNRLTGFLSSQGNNDAGQEKDSHEVVLVVIHTFQEVAADEWVIRIISAWKAAKNEIEQYEDYEI